MTEMRKEKLGYEKQVSNSMGGLMLGEGLELQFFAHPVAEVL